jgi:hypothetical protein
VDVLIDLEIGNCLGLLFDCYNSCAVPTHLSWFKCSFYPGKVGESYGIGNLVECNSKVYAQQKLTSLLLRMVWPDPPLFYEGRSMTNSVQIPHTFSFTYEPTMIRGPLQSFSSWHRRLPKGPFRAAHLRVLTLAFVGKRIKLGAALVLVRLAKHYPQNAQGLCNCTMYILRRCCIIESTSN